MDNPACIPSVIVRTVYTKGSVMIYRGNVWGHFRLNNTSVFERLHHRQISFRILPSLGWERHELDAASCPETNFAVSPSHLLATPTWTITINLFSEIMLINWKDTVSLEISQLLIAHVESKASRFRQPPNRPPPQLNPNHFYRSAADF